MKRAPFRLLAVALVLAAAPALVDHAAVAGEVHAQTPAPTPTVEVLDAGKAPLEPLRLAPAAGASQRSAMTVTFAIQQSGVSSGSVKPPPTKATVETTLQGVTPRATCRSASRTPSSRC